MSTAAAEAVRAAGPNFVAAENGDVKMLKKLSSKDELHPHMVAPETLEGEFPS